MYQPDSKLEMNSIDLEYQTAAEMYTQIVSVPK